MKKQLLLIGVLSIFCVGVQAQKRTVRKKLSLENTVFYIKNVAANKYLDLPGAGVNANKGNGSKVQLWDMDNGNDRKFKLKPAGGGYYYIMPQHCNSRLDVHGCWPNKWFCETYKNEKGAGIQIWRFDSNDIGKWRLEQVRPGQFIIVNKYSNMALDANGHRIKENGCNICQWDIHKRDNQLWEFISVDTGQRYEQ